MISISKKKIYRYLKQISPVETMSLVKNSSIFWNSPVFLWICGCCYLMFILIISAIGGLAEWTYYDWLLQLSNNRCPITATCPITLSSYNCTEWLVKNEAANAPIIFEEFVMVMIKGEIRCWTLLGVNHTKMFLLFTQNKVRMKNLYRHL